jgi:hypothetical protein
LEQYLCCTVNYQQDDWTDLLPLAEFAYNNTLHSSIKQTPFFSNYGHHPRADPFQVKDVGSSAAHLAAIHNEFAFQHYEAQDHYKDCRSQSEDISQFSHWGSRMAFTTEYTNKKTIKKVGLSMIGSIQNYCASKSS